VNRNRVMRLYENAGEVYRTLGHPTRLRIRALLRLREACVCELVTRLPISQPAVSQHLRKLRQAGFLTEEVPDLLCGGVDLPPLLAEIVVALPLDPEDEAWFRSSPVERLCSGPAAGTATASPRGRGPQAKHVDA